MEREDVRELAMELALLDGVEYQFDSMVKQLIEEQREMATARILARPGAKQEESARDFRILESALEKIEHNLRTQYLEFLSTCVEFRLENMSVEELSHYVTTLCDNEVQRYFAKMRSLQPESEFIFRQLRERMIRKAVGGDA